MALIVESRLRALATQEIEELGRASPSSEDLMSTLQRLEAQARAMFLLEEREVPDVRHVLSQHRQAWIEFIRSDLTSVVWTGSDGPQASEYLMVICELSIVGLLSAIAAGDGMAVAAFRARFFDCAPPEPELSLATLLLTRQLLLLAEMEFDRADREMEEGWSEWVDSELVTPPDALWSGLRGIAANDVARVEDALLELSRARGTALHHAVERGLVLRSTLPVMLTLQMDAAALVRLARLRGMGPHLAGGRFLVRRAEELWQLGG
ncbi:hypothetical protein [Corallococcus sp. CA054B]|uniref:hypothetical protein n=1 Tax=Corallococcus sp. CA054B TaxID=2316734 RepID=UPI0011C3A208|nr:hypothetical protein [Corallococcus sp. CA054B]